MSYEPQNPDEQSVSLLQSSLIELKHTKYAGRTVIAKTHLSPGSEILVTPSSSSPVAHVILQEYRREVCAQCFAYDRGRHWPVKVLWTSCAVAFCSDECLTSWKEACGDTVIAAHEAVETVVKSSQRRQAKLDRNETSQTPDLDENNNHSSDARAPTPEEITSVLDDYQARGSALKLIRSRQVPLSRKDARTLHDAANPPELEIDTLRFLLSGFLFARSYASPLADPNSDLNHNNDSHEIPSILYALEPDPNLYKSFHALKSICAAYLALVAILPLSLLHSTSASTNTTTTPITLYLAHNLLIRASHNAFSIRPPPTSDGSQSGEFTGWGIWPEASFFNHSCEPNVEKGRVGRRWRFWVRGGGGGVGRDDVEIEVGVGNGVEVGPGVRGREEVGSGVREGQELGVKKGEELCITYLGGEEEGMDVRARRERLKEHWGFWCMCARCVNEDGGEAGAG